MSQKKKFKVPADRDKCTSVNNKNKAPFLTFLIVAILLLTSYKYLNKESLKTNHASISILPDEQGQRDEKLIVESPKLTEFHREMIDKYCIDCHDSVSEEGGVNLEGLSLEVGKDLQTAEMWDHVLKAVNSGEMPPKKKKQLPKDLKLNFLKELTTAMVGARKKLGDRNGEVTMRRLNRREYVNTMVDLLGIEPKEDTYLLLPKDEDLDGFDTNGNSLYFSSHQFELYRKIAKETLGDLLKLYGTKKPKSRIVRTEVEINTKKDVLKEYTGLKERYDQALAYLRGDKDAPKLLDKMKAKKSIHTYTNFALILKDYLEKEENNTGQTLLVYKFHDAKAESHSFRPKTGGKYKVRFKVATINNPKDGYVYAKTQDGYKKISGTMDKPQIVSFEQHLRPSNDKHNFNMVIRNPLSRSQRWNFFMSEVKRNGIGPESYLWVDWVEVEGPIHEKWPPYNLGELVDKPRSTENHYAYVERVLTQFAKKAFRNKQPSQAYISKLVDIYKEFGGNEKNFKTSIIEPMSIILASPSFLYISEPANKDDLQVSDHELAIRLSYFLWSSPPDTELLALAESGRLSNPETLRQQTERLLSDTRAKGFIEGFTYQWLGMRDIDTFQFDAENFPDFDENIRQLAKEEMYQSVQYVLDNDKPLQSLIDSDYVVVNDRLANYYGIPNVEGSDFRPVKVTKESSRGGLLGMAAFHILGSDGKESNLVKRGAWVLTHLLNDPPPPAPADVPQLSRLEGDTPVTARVLHKKHMEEPQCAQCHVTIDPIGYGLENFDAAGKWRQEIVHQDVSKVKKRKKREHKTTRLAIDPSGALPNGNTFENFYEMRSEVSKLEKQFSQGFLESLIAYGLARDYSFVDEELAASLYEKAHEEGNTMRSYIHGLIQSKAFKFK